MQKGEKIAIARIFDDLIKADHIVNTGEMRHWKKMCLKYEIDKDIKIAARDLSFADALRRICKTEEENLKTQLLADCMQMTVSDGFCAHSEALVMIALTILFDSECTLLTDVISIPRSNFNIETATALYIENEYDEDTNRTILANYRSISKEFRMAGFHFIYIPKIIEHYKNTDSALFHDILSFLAPSMDKEKLSETYASLMNMTTGKFCQDLLCNKCGITDLRQTIPALLIKISNSYVGDTLYANYLKIEADDGILSTVRDFIDKFSAMLSSDTFVVSTSEERDNQFHFHGFYKQLLDIFLVQINTRSRIILNPYKKGKITFPDIGAQAGGVCLRERALYALLLCQGKDGINFKAPATAAAMKKYNERMHLIQKRYAAIYEMFGGKSDTVPDLSDPVIRRPIVSCLRKSISRLGRLYNHEDYNVTSGADGVISVHIEPELVFIQAAESKEPVPLKQSELYRRWKIA